MLSVACLIARLADVSWTGQTGFQPAVLCVRRKTCLHYTRLAVYAKGIPVGELLSGYIFNSSKFYTIV